MDEKIKKLPKWAQEHIKDIERQRSVAITALNKYVDTQTPSPFYIDDWECTGEETGPTTKRRYIQTHSLTVNHGGVSLDIYLRDQAIDLQWGTLNRSVGEVAFIPKSFQNAKIVAKENMD